MITVKPPPRGGKIRAKLGRSYLDEGGSFVFFAESFDGGGLLRVCFTNGEPMVVGPEFQDGDSVELGEEVDVELTWRLK